MTSSDAVWLKFWELFSATGFILVIIGCVIEGVEHFIKFTRQEQKQKSKIEKFGWLVLVVGLAMEFGGEHKAKRIADKENARLTAEAGFTRKEASEAVERASTVESNNASLRLRVEELRKANFVLQSELLKYKPRDFSDEMQAYGLSLLKKYSGTPIVFRWVSQDPETDFFTRKLSELLTSAGWKVTLDEGCAPGFGNCSFPQH